ncbi:hypothetical protein DSM106972_090590 [Dulcicalothrix desertica PCC 7102]|uniref:Carrier domain-containing protein n=1 Tax=Dulcicalothrix desertica PCC 7102 TaxID=232991 RepID=A0A3S1C4M9_9CYAN|nr:non-ribosomal peptide synthetase [Dulcicalothrix desertica]RUS95283.1 hypothetical protein DSM106972_090590 [Dulcicalothrix desertica PCC 7102]TWH43971.1 non-ribosomal peptide synthase protein (TIGR01720 family)/amino acid adenylation domain-containing protein [Dulcicalothrix desertica PCC 7102]
MQSLTGNAFRISPQQKHVWLLQESDNSHSYLSQIGVHIEGDIQPDILKAALESIVNRQEIFRTNFYCLPGDTVPVQSIIESKTVSIYNYDFSGLAAQEQQTKINALFEEARLQDINLEKSQILHIALIKLSSYEHILFVSLPVLCADWVTLNNLVYEIGRSYTAYLHGQEISDESMQYADISEWLNELLESEDTKTGIEYWRQQNISSLLNLKLPLESQPSGKERFEPQSLSLNINSDTVVKIKKLAQKYNTSISAFLLACWQVLLWRLTEKSEVVIGTACEGRKHQELKNAFGLLAKYVPIHFNLKANFKFQEVLEQISRSLHNIDTWQEYFAWELAVTDTDLAPHFFPFCFDFTEQAEKYTTGDVSFSVYKQYACTDRFKVKLSSVCRDDFLLLDFFFDSSLFLVDDIKTLSEQYCTLLESAINNPEAAISDLEILSKIQQQQLLIEFNNTKTDYPEHKCIHQLFEEQVERTPDSIAVVFENEHLTYAELNARSNQLAHELQELGVKPEALVAIYLEPSLEMVIGIFGILKAGGAYVPLDSSYPQERLAFMLEDAQVQLVLTQQKLVKSLPDKSRVICLDKDWEAITYDSNKKPVSTVKPENLAYVIYTSGSTGKPKGTMISHQGLVNYVTWCAKAYAVADGEGAPVNSSIGFDATITSLFSPLLVGQKVILLPENQKIEYLSNLLSSKNDFSLVKITPAHLEILSELLPQNQVPTRTKAFIIGGEALPPTSVAFWQTHAPHTKLINEYGPTETVVGCCVYEVPQQSSLANSIPIGRPIANVQLYILDEYLQPVPIGASGELYIGGAGIARGYLNRPELTAEKFIPNPFCQEKGGRLYKTGDLACYLPDGNINFLGRVDSQVKIRGFRIELEEIEAVLKQHPQVQKAVVIVREDTLGNKRLVAYVIPDQKQSTTGELSDFVKQKLPEYMAPNIFVFIDTLPLTPNGKINHSALPVPDTSKSLEKDFVLPRTQTEEILATIWTQVLGLKQVSIYDNFFELGGDSIQSIQITARANQAGLQISPRQLFQHQTIAELATVTETIPFVQVEQDTIVGSVPLTPIQHWFFEQNLPEQHHFNQSLLLDLQQDFDPDRLEKAIQQLIIHHDALRLHFVQEASHWQQFNADTNVAVSLDRVDLSALSEAEQKLALEAAANDLQASLNLSNAPLMRVTLFDLGSAQPNKLLWVIHHLVVDGVSWRILLEDLQTVYQQLNQGEPIALPPKTTSFKHWSQSLSEYTQSPELEEELKYWLAKPRFEVPSLPVEHLFVKENNTVASSRTVSVALSSADTKALLQEVPQVYNTQINDVLLTALVLAFNSSFGKRRLLVDLEGHGRENLFQGVNLSRTVGWFTTIFPVLLDLEETIIPGEALKSVKEQLRQIPKQGINYGLLRYLKQDKAISARLQAMPQAEVLFNYLGQFDTVISSSSLFEIAQQSIGAESNPQGNRSHLLEINALVSGGQLQLNWTYSEAVHHRATIENLAQEFIAALQNLIVHCQSPEAGGYTPSDFPYSGLNLQKIKKLLGNNRQIEDIYPASPLQDEMIFEFTEYYEDSQPGIFLSRLHLELHGALNVPAFKRAWQEVVARHSIFRTAFLWEELDKSLQVVYKQVTLPWEQQDWRGLSPKVQSKRLKKFLGKELNQSFDLSKAPLMRFDIIQTAENVHQFIWTQHQLLTDGWSLSLVFKEASILYREFCQGKDVYLEKPRPYRDYIAWLQEQDLLKAEKLWRQELQGLTKLTTVDVDEEPSPFSDEEEYYNTREIALSQLTTTDINTWVQQHHLTLNTIVQAVWALLLSRYSKQEQVLFWTVVSGRPATVTGVEEMVGLFINEVFLQLQVSVENPLLSWLKEIQIKHAKLRQYDYFPLISHVEEWVKMPESPWFDSLLIFQNYPVIDALQELPDNLEIKFIDYDEKLDYPLMVKVVPGVELNIAISYSCQYFDADEINCLLGDFKNVLETIIAVNPQEKISVLKQNLFHRK